MRYATLFLAAVVACFALQTDAEAAKKKKKSTITGKVTYSWVDENGVTHYGDHVPSQYSQSEQRILNEQGVEVLTRDAQMTPAQAAEYAARQKEEAARKQHDMFLLSTYPSVKDIETVRDVRLDQIDGQITAAEAYIASLTTRIEGLKKRSLNYLPYNTKPGARRMPDDLAEELVRAMSELRTQNSGLAQRRAEHAKVASQFNADIDRFKELRTTAAARR